MADIGWRFPLVDGGNQDGFRDAGIETFRGAEGYSGLARETIQNSLDARRDEDAPVEMAFEVRDWPIEAIGGQGLADSFRACRDATEKEEDPEEWGFFDRGLRRLTGEFGETVKVLVISDRNTTGLRPANWETLLKVRGKSRKAAPGAGGSFGIGRNAAFGFSEIRTVFYWTALRERGDVPQRFQGKSILKSHDKGDGMTQGTGYWGRTEECGHVGEESIPEVVGSLREWTDQGTAVCIVGFYPDDGWQTQMLKSVVCNYFFAIAKGRLTVSIGSDPDGQPIRVERGTLTDRIHSLANDPSVGKEAQREVRKAEAYLGMTTAGLAATYTENLRGLGKCNFLIRTRNIPENIDVKRVGFIRNPGLLITDSQAGLRTPRNMDDYLGIFLCEDPQGNEFLRRIENPQHNQFEVSRIADPKGRRAAQSVMNRAYVWITNCIKDACAGETRTPGKTLDELAEYIPFAGSEPFDGRGRDERDFDGTPTIVSGQTRKSRITSESEEEDEDDDPPDRGRRPVAISDVRVLPVEDGAPNSRLICFDPSESGDVKIRVYAAGDTNNTYVGETTARAEKGVRARVPFWSDSSLDGALVIKASAEK